LLIFLWYFVDSSIGCSKTVWVEDSYGMLGNMTSLSINMVGTAACALKTTTNGGFYVPNPAYVNATYIRVELLFHHVAGDQTSNTTSPYGTIKNYPDGWVNMLDVSFVEGKFMLNESQNGWDYMADVFPDRAINMVDIQIVINNYFKNETCTYDLSGVTVRFDAGQVESPDADGFLQIPHA
jgi:hypothetical protein